MISISQAHADARLEGSRTLMIAGTARPKLRIYGATRPVNGAAPGSPLLVEIELNPASAEVSNGALTIQQFAPGLIVATGQPTWARIVNGNGAHVLDCDAGGPGASTEIVVSAATLYQGGRVLLVGATFA
ncbi:MAG: hypothetical protein RIS35_3741 [Pseudomonadota bacterium]